MEPPDLRDALRPPFVPALALVVGVVLAMETGTYAGLGLQALFASFLVGVVAVPLSVVGYVVGVLPERATRDVLVGGLALSGAAVALYLVYGCVFGCPG
ncbi:MAG: hypothetical protein ABEJ06_02795 [Haloarculaceae archaeon]